MNEPYIAIHDTLLPFFELAEPLRKHVTEALVPQARIYHTTKYQLLEEPGEAAQSQFMLVLQGLVDSYYHCSFTRKLWGRHVYYRHDVIFAAESFYHGVPRTDYIRALEPSTLLALPHSAIRALAERFPEVQSKLQRLMASRTQYLLAYNLRNTLPAPARVRTFLEQHPTLPHRTTAEVCAMHNHMSRHWYSKILKTLN